MGGVAHDCNAGCRGGEHCTLLYNRPDIDPAAYAATFAGGLAALGLTYTRHESAPEAPPPDWRYRMSSSREGVVAWANPAECADYVPVLVWWRR